MYRKLFTLVFAIQNGGACFSGINAEDTYKRYGKSEACKGGRGGPFANSVYKSFEDGKCTKLSSHLTFTSSNSTIETLGKGVKYVQS